MSIVSDLQRELADVRRELGRLQADTESRFVAVSSQLRKQRVGIAESELRSSIDRLKPPIDLMRWSPRDGEMFTPDLNQSLIDRLKRGDPVSDTLGNIDAVPGQANILDELAFEEYTLSSVTLTTTPQTVGWASAPVAATPGYAWQAYKTAGSAATCTTYLYKTRDKQATNPFNSGCVLLRIVPTGSGTHTVYLESSPLLGSSAAVPMGPYLVAAVRAARLTANTYTAVTSRTFTVEIYDIDDATVRASNTFDLTLLSDTDEAVETVWTAMANYSLTGAQQAHQWRLRIKLVLVTSASGADVSYYFGDPRVHYSGTPDPISFAPLVSGWYPNAVVSYGGTTSSYFASAKTASDTYLRFRINTEGNIAWGPGSSGSLDAALRRTDVRTLTLDDNATHTNPIEVYLYGVVNLLRGNSTDIALAASAWGDSTPYRFALDADGTMEWGSGGATRDTNLYRSAASELKTDDTFVAATDVKVGTRSVLTRSFDMIGPFEDVDVASGIAADTALPFIGGAAGAFSSRPIAGRAGRVRGLSWRISAAPTAGSITISPSIAGATKTTGAVTINSGSGTNGYSDVTSSWDTFAAGTSLGVNYTSTSSPALDPLTLDLGVWLNVEWD